LPIAKKANARRGSRSGSGATRAATTRSLGSNGGTPAAEHRTVARVMSILELVLASESNGMRLGDLSGAIDAPKSSVHGLAKGLVATGYFREEGGRYFLGPAISSLFAVGAPTLPSVYHHALEELKNRWNETAMLATLVGDSLVYLDAVNSDALVRAAPQLNKRLPLWPRSAGKVFLAFMEPRRFETYLRRNHPDPAEADHVREEVAKTHEAHVGFSRGETIAGNLGIACPIIVRDLPVSVAIAVVGPRTRMDDHADDVARSLLEMTAALSQTVPLE